MTREAAYPPQDNVGIGATVSHSRNRAPALARWYVVVERKGLGTEEPVVDPGVASFVRACDEVLEFHERAGSSEGAAARQVRAKREELLNDSKATPTDPPFSAGAASKDRDGRG